MLLTLLFYVIILGIFAAIIYAIPIPQPFKTIAYLLLLLILVIALFSGVGGHVPTIGRVP